MEREWGLESNLATWLPFTAGPGKVQTLSLPCLVRKMRLTTTVVHKVLLGLNDGKGNGNPLPYSCLENPMDRGAWQAAVHGVAKSQTWLKWLSSSSSRIKRYTHRWSTQASHICPRMNTWSVFVSASLHLLPLSHSPVITFHKKLPLTPPGWVSTPSLGTYRQSLWWLVCLYFHHTRGSLGLTALA